MNPKLYLTITILLFDLFTYISTDNIQNRSNWWKEVSNNNITDYVPSGTVRSLINSTISGNQYWPTNHNGQNLVSNNSENYNEIVQPETIVLPGRNGNTKIVRKIKRTFKKETIKPNKSDQPAEEAINDWKENSRLVEPSVVLDHQNQQFLTTSSPIINLARASTNNLIQSTASEVDNLITSKIKWDDDYNELPVPLSRSPIFKTKINKQESIYEKYASIMPLPPPSTQTATTNQVDHNSENSNNNLQSSSHHSVVAPLSSANNNNYFNFNSKVVHTLPASRSNENKDTNKNQRRKQNKKARNLNNSNRAKTPIQDFFLEADKIDKSVDNDQHLNKKKTVDFTSRVNHEITPNNNILAQLLKNNPFAIPIGKKTYKVTKKATTTQSTPSANLPSTVISKRTNSPTKYATSSTGFNSISSSLRNDDDTYTTTPMSTLTNDNLDNINFKAKPSTQDYTWGRRVQSSSNIISKTNSKANQLSKRNEWSENDEQKDRLSEHNNNESEEESVENDENTNEETEPINDNELNNEFNKNIAAIRNEESPKFDVVTFKTNNKNSNQVKSNSNSVKSLPIQIISWRQAINHRKKGKESEVKIDRPFAGERITSAKLVVKKEQQVEREKPSPKAFSSKPTTKQPSSSTTSAKLNTNSFKTTSTPKLTSSRPTTRSVYQTTAQLTTKTESSQSTGKRTQNTKSTRSPINSFVANRKNEAYIAPQISKTKPAQLFQDYEDEKETFREELEDNFINRQNDLHSSPKKENRVKYAKNQEFRKKSLNLIEDKNENSIENTDQTEATKPIPVTSFKCSDQGLPGYYGDVETGCTVFHICQDNNRKDSFFCPPGTAFNQQLLVCDWINNINCEASNRKPNPNVNVFNNNAYESSNNLRNSNNNYETDDALEEEKKK